jgi:hypothetical protein
MIYDRDHMDEKGNFVGAFDTSTLVGAHARMGWKNLELSGQAERLQIRNRAYGLDSDPAQVRYTGQIRYRITPTLSVRMEHSATRIKNLPARLADSHSSTLVGVSLRAR